MRSRSRTGKRARDEEKEEMVLLTRGLWRLPQPPSPAGGNRAEGPTVPVEGALPPEVPAGAAPERASSRFDELELVTAAVVAALTLAAVGVAVAALVPPL